MQWWPPKRFNVHQGESHESFQWSIGQVKLPGDLDELEVQRPLTDRPIGKVETMWPFRHVPF